MGQKHLFIIDPLEKINLELDTTIRMIRALGAIGHQCFITHPEYLSLEKTQKYTCCICEHIQVSQSEIKPTIRLSEKRCISFFDIVHMRKDPPYDMNYITVTWMLDSRPSKTKVLNSPRALREINEKLVILNFPQYTDAVLLSSDPQEILDFIRSECGGDAIAKPLDLFGGKGILRLVLDSSTDREKIQEELFGINRPHKSPRLIQPFNKQIYNGEIRVFTAGAVPLAYCLKKPKKGSYFANTSSGASLQHYKPDKEFETMIIETAKELLDLGVFFAGFDIIGDRISEINITSPRLLLSDVDDEKLIFENLAGLIVEYCETKIDF